ncbi:MAG: response regulator [Gemmatimonadetes bacterium]|nr:response regulator [Gemmatimonadota bacterium]
MAELDKITFMVKIRVVKRGEAFSPRPVIVQRQGSTFKSISLDMKEELFYTEAAARENGMASVREKLEKQFPRTEIKFGRNLPTMPAILLIDDSHMVQDIVSSLLEAEGYQVEVADDLAQGVKKLREQKFDLLLVDLNLPEVRGEAGIKLFRQRLKLATPIIVLSGEIKVQTVLDMKPLDVSAFVAKGEDFEEKLIEEVTRILVEKGRIHGRLG